MNDEEYREFLGALAKKYLRTERMRLQWEPSHAWHEMDRLSALSRFVRAVAEHNSDERLHQVLGHDLENTYLDGFHSLLEYSGTLDALEDSPEIIFGEMRRSVIPPEDLDFLRRAGVLEPDAEITIWVQHTRRMSSCDRKPGNIVRKATDEIHRVGKELQEGVVNENSNSARKPRKILNGVGKILSGAVAGTGNVLLGAGAIVAPNPALGATVIASAAIAIGAIFQGLGDLRGE